MDTYLNNHIHSQCHNILILLHKYYHFLVYRSFQHLLGIQPPQLEDKCLALKKMLNYIKFFTLEVITGERAHSTSSIAFGFGYTACVSNTILLSFKLNCSTKQQTFLFIIHRVQSKVKMIEKLGEESICSGHPKVHRATLKFENASYVKQYERNSQYFSYEKQRMYKLIICTIKWFAVHIFLNSHWKN